MSYRIDFGKSFEDEIRRLALELLESAIDALTHSPDGPLAAIHAARKDIKRTRALLRLIASEAKGFARSENRKLAGIARTLSALRDGAALTEITVYLETTTADEGERDAIRTLGRKMKTRCDTLVGDARKVEATLLAAVASLRDARRSMKTLSLPDRPRYASDCVAKGWTKTGKLALKAVRAGGDARSDDAFHELRKRAQDRWMHATLLEAIWPGTMRIVARQAKSLVDLLGHANDLSALGELVEADRTAEGGPTQPQVLALISAERLRLQQSALKAATDLFDPKPKRDAAVIALLVRHSR